MEQPTHLITRPLNLANQDDRIRAIHGRTSDDPLPPINGETLQAWYDYLNAHLTFPFEVTFGPEWGSMRSYRPWLTITRLTDPDENDVEEGLFCETTHEEITYLPLAFVKSKHSSPNRQLVDDYVCWFHNADFGDEGTVEPRGPTPQRQTPDEELERPAAVSPGRVLLTVAIISGIYGIVFGAIYPALPWAASGALVGAAVVAVAGCLAGAFLGAVNRVAFGTGLGMILGTVVGMLVGALLGVLAAAFLGSLPGALVGGLIGYVFSRKELRNQKMVKGLLIGALFGGLGLAIYHDRESAFVGLLYGALIGPVAGVLLLLCTVGLVFIVGGFGGSYPDGQDQPD
jgi:hypothetical protein